MWAAGSLAEPRPRWQRCPGRACFFRRFPLHQTLSLFCTPHDSLVTQPLTPSLCILSSTHPRTQSLGTAPHLPHSPTLPPPQPTPFFSGHVFNLLYSCSCLPLFHHGAPVCPCAIISQTLLLRPQVLFVLGPWCYVVCLLLRWRWAPTSLLDNSPASTAEVGCRRTCSRTCSRRSPYGPRFAP